MDKPLAKMFEECGVQPSVFLFEWVLTAYTNVFSISHVGRIWDSWLLHGEAYMHRVGFAILYELLDQKPAP
jgi:hypothetical protein